jgi:DNA repair exonuclease SbcCD ATPase subunit
MKDLLEFLNSAKKEQLAEVQGISENLAEKIIAARPFEEVEDSLDVKGFGKNLLSRLENAYNDRVDTQPLKIEEARRALPTYEEPNTEYEDEVPREKKSRGFWRAVGRIFRFLFWLIVIVGIIGGIGAAFYYGLPYIQKTFIQPLNVNTAQIRQIATEQAESMDGLNTTIEELDSRVGSIETQLETIEGEIEAKTEAINQLERRLAALDEQIDETQDALTTQIRDNLTVTYALELVARARLHLDQSNYGIAQMDIQTALEQDRQIMVDKAVNRLELAESILPDFPVVAANDLDIAWYLLVEVTP